MGGHGVTTRMHSGVWAGPEVWDTPLPVRVSGDEPRAGDWAVRWGDVGCRGVGRLVCRAGRFEIWTVQSGVQDWEVQGMDCAVWGAGLEDLGYGLCSVGCRTGRFGVWIVHSGVQGWEVAARCRASLAPQSSQFNCQSPSKIPSCRGLGQDPPGRMLRWLLSRGQIPGVPSCLTEAPPW